jgi:hypothetical protein
MTTQLVRTVIFAGALLALTSGVVTGQTLDPASHEALAAVLRMLNDPALRGAAIAGSPQAGAAAAQIDALTKGSPALTQEVYALAGEIFEDLTRGSGGDAQAMGQALARGQGDPAGLSAMLSPRTLEHLRALSIKLSDEPRRK